MTAPLELVMADATAAAPGIRSLTLRPVGGGRLPSYTPGSHLVVRAGERTNAYSLTGDGVDPSEYTISVLRVDDGAGGSVWMHDALHVGDHLSVDPPRSAFPPVASATRHLLVAGGIGVTPILSHLRSAVRWGRPVDVLYAYRQGYGAHVADLVALGGEDVHLLPERAGFEAALRSALARQPVGAHVYVCGPAGLVDLVTRTAAELAWPAARVHLERFGADALDPGEPFTITLTRSGTTAHVPSGTSLLEVLEAAGIAVPNLCRQGVCGECRTPVTGGRPLHRDLYLTDEEKSAGDCLMPCVSRAETATLEVPL